MVNSFFFAQMPAIHFGVGRFDSLTNLLASSTQSVLLVTGSSSFEKSGRLASFCDQLKSKEIDCFREIITGEPTPEMIDTITNRWHQTTIDYVIAIGGGSVIDAGKAISAMLPLNEPVEWYLEVVGHKTHSGIKIPFIAVPTTSGTGSEATKNAVISKPGALGYKRSLRHDNFVPNIALVDPSLTLTCPQSVTAACGLDAFTQLLESYVSTKSTAMSDALALDGMRAILQGLDDAYHNNTIEARTDMSYAAMLSGITLANAGLGVVHGYASSIGGFFDIPHGVVCGTMLAAATEKTIKHLKKNQTNPEALKRYNNVGMLITDNFEMYTNHATDELMMKLSRWTKTLNMPRLSTYGVKAEDLEKIAEVTDNKNNPARLSKSEILEILKERL